MTEQPKKPREITFGKAYKSLEDVVIVEEDGKFKMFAMVEDAASDPIEEKEIIEKVEFAFKVKIKKS